MADKSATRPSTGITSPSASGRLICSDCETREPASVPPCWPFRSLRCVGGGISCSACAPSDDHPRNYKYHQLPPWLRAALVVASQTADQQQPACGQGRDRSPGLLSLDWWPCATRRARWGQCAHLCSALLLAKSTVDRRKMLRTECWAVDSARRYCWCVVPSVPAPGGGDDQTPVHLKIESNLIGYNKFRVKYKSLLYFSTCKLTRINNNYFATFAK